MSQTVKVKALTDKAFIPERKHQFDAGADLHSAFGDFVLPPNTPTLVGTGLAVQIPEGYVGMVCPRSGLAVRGVTVMNAPGIVDSGYRGELKVNLVNLSDHQMEICYGDRIAQLLIVPVDYSEFEVVDELNESEDGRGESGHGSTGR